MNPANILALLITLIAIFLPESVAEPSYFRQCDGSACRNVCEESGALRWSCEREGCLCTFLFDEGAVFDEELPQGGSMLREDDNMASPYFHVSHDIQPGTGRKPKRPEKKRPKFQGEKMEEVIGLGEMPMARIAKQEDTDVLKSRVKGSKKGKPVFPFVVQGGRRLLSMKEVMDQLKEHKGAYPFEKIHQFLNAGGRR